ncbi:MAG TPA: tetratricopeptide repeat protein [Longimicrobiales bacterium]|nr:tetratricopeptide repeat protein [Longimicrobiales bacterium]
MIELRTLGTISVHMTGGREPRALLPQGKRVALLLYLALERPRTFHRREVLLGLFWPDSTPERARRALNQSIYVLRRALGADAIEARGYEELGIAAGAVTCDALEFERALAEGRTADALSLYGGRLLDGFDAEGAAGFERWLEEERGRYRDAAVSAALAHAAALEDAGEVVEAAYWTRRACSWAEFDERVLRELLLRLDRAGDRAGALREYATFVASLEAELGLDPEDETAALAERLRERTAHRAAVTPPVPAVTPPQSAAAALPSSAAPLPAAPPSAAAPSPAAPDRERRVQRRWGRYAAAAALSAVVLWAGVGRWDVVPRGISSAEVPQRPRVLVAALSNQTGDSALDALGRLAADWIAQGLTRSALVEAVPVAAVLRAERALIAELGPELAPAVALRLARENGAGLVVHGGIFRSGDSATVTVQLRDTTGRVLRAITGIGLRASDPLPGLRRLREQMIGAVATAVDARFSGWSDAASQPPSLQAYQLYAEGLAAYLRMDWLEATTRFRRAAQLDSAFTAPLVWALRAHWNAGQYAATDSIIARILPLRDRMEPWDRAIFGYFHADARGDPPGTYHALQRVVAISPGSEWVYHLGVAALYTNRPREAIQHLRAVDPERGWLKDWRPYWPVLLEAYHNGGQFAGELQAIADMERARGAAAPAARLRALAALGRVPEAVQLHRQLLAERGQDWRAARRAIALARELKAHGSPDHASALLEATLVWFDRIADDTETPMHAGTRALLLYELGSHDAARALLEAGAAERRTWENMGHLGLTAAATGDTATALAAERWFQEQHKRTHYGEDTVWRAGIMARLGYTARALQLLQQAYDEGLNQSLSLHVHPALAPLWGVARFEARMRPAG